MTAPGEWASAVCATPSDVHGKGFELSDNQDGMNDLKPNVRQAAASTGRSRFLRQASLAAASMALARHGSAWSTSPVSPTSPASPPSPTQSAAPDYRIEIQEIEWELSPRKKIRTSAYDGQIPGRLLNLTEGKPVAIEIVNRLDHPEIVHWHGQWIPVEADGAMEEGSLMIPAGSSTRVAFTPRPAGLHWYHTHAMAERDLKRGLYSGQFGVLHVATPGDPGRYDQQQFIVLHDWEPFYSPSDDGSLMVMYGSGSINGRMLGYDRPIQVRQGQRVLFQILNASATEPHWLALPGHRFQVIALDGAPVAKQAQVEVLRLGPAERVSALVTMNTPGVWILGEAQEWFLKAGMGTVIEYAGHAGKPLGPKSVKLQWDYRAFGAAVPTRHTPDVILPLVFASRFRGHGALDEWRINGKSWPATDPIQLSQGLRHRLVFVNRSSDDHPVHLHRHNFELVSIRGNPISGVFKDVVIVEAGTTVEADLIAANPGNSLFHCHQQDHMDAGFMALFRYT